mgnify:CR=1 FL=1
MEHPGFFDRAGPFTLARVLEVSEAEAPAGTDLNMEIVDVLPLDQAGNRQVSFFDNPKYLEAFQNTRAAACFVSEKYAEKAPAGTIPLKSNQPYRSFALALGKFYPDALRQARAERFDSSAYKNGVHKTAKLEEGVLVQAGAIIGPEVQIGKGTTVAAGACIEYRTYIGRDCYIGPNITIPNSLIGNRVILHPGICIGQDGFGFAMGPQGHLKVPQIGRVIIQDDVEIGANSTIDRGALKDTVIGEGTKIDNLVQIGHNVIVGRHCVIVSQVGIAGSVTLGDGVVLGGQAGISGHVQIGSGAQIAAQSGIHRDVPSGERWGGSPIKPMSIWLKEVALLRKLVEQRGVERPKNND